MRIDNNNYNTATYSQLGLIAVRKKEFTQKVVCIMPTIGKIITDQ